MTTLHVFASRHTVEIGVNVLVPGDVSMGFDEVDFGKGKEAGYSNGGVGWTDILSTENKSVSRDSGQNSRFESPGLMPQQHHLVPVLWSRYHRKSQSTSRIGRKPRIRPPS